jgi:hypothetical protein
MPVNFRIDVARKLVISECQGVVTGADLFDHQSLLGADPRFQPDFWQLFDFTGATEIHVSVEDVRELAARSPFRAGSKRAVVVSRPVHFGLVRMFDALTDEHAVDLRVFYDVAEAWAWLGMRP